MIEKIVAVVLAIIAVGSLTEGVKRRTGGVEGEEESPVECALCELFLPQLVERSHGKFIPNELVLPDASRHVRCV
uniref:Secreted protein n=1 Tax=Lutzomyia longipalpis TaxID=7200 RepID=A0A1B0GJR5_LUTLO